MRDQKFFKEGEIFSFLKNNSAAIMIYDGESYEAYSGLKEYIDSRFFGQVIFCFETARKVKKDRKVFIYIKANRCVIDELSNHFDARMKKYIISRTHPVHEMELKTGIII